MKKISYRRAAVMIAAVMIGAVVLAGCADVTNIDACRPADPYGFLWGLWHGLIAPVSFFGSLLSDSIAMYAINNNGGWYDFGFVLGTGILFGGGSRSVKR